MNLLGTIYKNEPHLALQVRAHIAKGEDVNTVTQYCESALRVGSNNGRFDVVKILLDAGADADQLDWTPTFHEVAYGDLDKNNGVGVIKFKSLRPLYCFFIVYCLLKVI